MGYFLWLEQEPENAHNGFRQEAKKNYLHFPRSTDVPCQSHGSEIDIYLAV
jgi:hypothetical protein